MECLHPIRIVNPSKYVSLYHRDKFVQYVRCGKCAECQKILSNEWYYRTYKEFEHTLKSGSTSYVLFDTLTYAPKYVPHISDFFPNIPRNLDYMCFDYKDIRDFLVRLRRRLSYLGYDVEDNLRFFCSTEYGTGENYTHRPHVHFLFFVTASNLDSYTLSENIARCWQKGRTDGLPYKTRAYVKKNTISQSDSAMRVCKYVSKYVMKSSSYQYEIDKRLLSIMRWQYQEKFMYFEIDYLRKYSGMSNFVVDKFDEEKFDSFMHSENGKKIYRDMKRHINQFHMQSLHYGECAINDFNFSEIMQTNIVTLPVNNKGVVMRIGLPTYYKRKLFYELVNVDGSYMWQPTELGKQYLEKRTKDLQNTLKQRFASKLVSGVEISHPEALADYVANYRGRIKGPFEQSTIEERLQYSDLMYSYVSPCDKKHFGTSFISFAYLGNKNGYLSDKATSSMTIDDFIQRNVYYNVEYERVLEAVERHKQQYSEERQAVFDNQQRRVQIYKSVFS